MNSVTCQASSERHRSLTPREVRAAAFSGRPLRRWGTHATAATRAGRAHRARAPRQPTPASWATGALRPAASAALMPSAVEYTLVMRPMRSGNSRLTMPGKSTLPTAIAAPKSAVPRKSAASAPHAEHAGQPRCDRREHTEGQERQRREQARHAVGYAGVRPDLADQGRDGGDRRTQVRRQEHEPRYEQPPPKTRWATTVGTIGGIRG